MYMERNTASQIACLILLITLLESDVCFAQADSTKSDMKSIVRWGRSNSGRFDKDSSMLMWGNVKLVLDRDSFFCDSAIWFKDDGIELMGNVRVVAKNKIDFKADKLKIDLSRLSE